MTTTTFEREIKLGYVSAEEALGEYACCWSIEGTFKAAESHLGFDEHQAGRG